MSRKMWARVLCLLGLVLVSVVLGYLIGSSTKPELAAAPSSASGFLVSNLSIQPAKVQPNEIVTITVSVANTHDTWGVYSLVLKIDGVKEAETQAELDAGSTKDVSFSVTREVAGTYTVFINGLSGMFTVLPPPAPAKPINWFAVGGVIAAGVAVVVVGLLFFSRKGKAT